jgi:hypothetical protein
MLNLYHDLLKREMRAGDDSSGMPLPLQGNGEGRPGIPE